MPPADASGLLDLTLTSPQHLIGDLRLRQVYMAHREKFLRWHETDRHRAGTRPLCWWAYEHPEAGPEVFKAIRNSRDAAETLWLAEHDLLDPGEAEAVLAERHSISGGPSERGVALAEHLGRGLDAAA